MSSSRSRITTIELKTILIAREKLAENRKSLREAEAHLASIEGEIMTRLREGAEIESKTYEAMIVTENGACRPAWKNEFIEHMVAAHGESPKEIEEDVRSRYPPEPREILAISLIQRARAAS